MTRFDADAAGTQRASAAARNETVGCALSVAS
jgi:hypothetical protein